MKVYRADLVAVGLAVLSGFLLFIGGWSLFVSLDAASKIGLSADFMIPGVSVLSVGIAVGILVGGVVCAFLAYLFSSAESWSTVEGILLLVLTSLVVFQVVYAHEGGKLPPSPGPGPSPSEPSLSGSFQLFANGVSLTSSVPFGIYLNNVRIGGDAAITLNSDLVLKDYSGVPGEVQFRIAFAYAPMTSSGQWASWQSMPIVKSVPNPMWRRSGSGWRVSIRNLQVVTISGTNTNFFYYRKCRFRFGVYAVLDDTRIATGSKSVDFVLESRSGSLEIEYAGGWAS